MVHPVHPYLDVPCEKLIGSDHFEVVRLMIENASTKGVFWKDLVRGVGLSTDRHTSFAVKEACRHIHHAPIRHFCRHVRFYLTEEPSTRAATRGECLKSFADWRTYHHELIGRLTSVDQEQHLEDLFALSVHAFLVGGVGEPSEPLHKRIQAIRGDLPIFADVSTLTPGNGLHPTLAGPLRAWWVGIMKADAAYREAQERAHAHQGETDTSLTDVSTPLHPDFTPVLQEMSGIVPSSSAWEVDQVTALVGEITALAERQRRARVNTRTAEVRAHLTTALMAVSGHLDQQSDVDSAALAMIAGWTNERVSDNHLDQVIIDIKALTEALVGVEEHRRYTEQMTGLSRREREARTAAFGVACDAVPQIIQRLAPLFATTTAAISATSPGHVPAEMPAPVPIPAPTVEPNVIRTLTQVVPIPVLTPVDHRPDPEPSIPDTAAVHSLTPVPEIAGVPVISTPAIVLQRAAMDREALGVWRLGSWNEFALAGHLAAARQLLSGDRPHLPAWLFHLAVVGRHLRSHDGKAGIIGLVHEACMSYTQIWRADGADTWNTGCRMLLAAGLLRSAILAPETGAAGVLVDLHFTGALRDLICTDIADDGRRFTGIGLHAIKGAQSRAVWQTGIESVRRRAQDWLESSRRRLLGPATAVWDHWIKVGQELPQAMAAVRADDSKRLAEVKSIGVRWNDDRTFAQMIADADRVVRPGTHRPTEARAKRQLEGRRDEAFAIIHEWIVLTESGKDVQASGQQGREAERLRQVLRKDLPRARHELDALVANEDVCVAAGAFSLRGAIEDLGRLFDPDAKLNHEGVAIEELLQADLVRVPTLRLSHDGGVADDLDPSAVVAAFMSIIDCAVVPSLDDAVTLRLADGDVRGAAIGIDYGLETIPPAIMTALQDRLEIVKREVIGSVRKQAEALLVDLEDTAALGTVLSEREYQNFKAEVQRIILRAERGETDNRRADGEILERIRQQVDKSREQQLASVRDQLRDVLRDGQPIPVDDPMRLKVVRALAKNEVLAALEYLDQLKSGDQDDGSSEVEPASTFFPARHEELYRLLTERRSEGKDTPISERLRAMIQASEPGAEAVPLERTAFHQRHPREDDLIEAWWGGRSTWRQGERHEQVRHVRHLLVALGFRPHSDPRLESGGRHPGFTVECTPIRDPQVIPVMTYGSLAEGRYRIMCVGEKHLLPADLLAEVRELRLGTGSPPLIVFLFQAWTPAQRRELAHLCCVSPAQTVIVIDDVLVLHGLRVMQQRSLLAELMRCALPFAYCKPYSTTAGLVPPEVFYGRSREREAIMAIDSGSSLVYGGRQLGKTALLREIQREMHQPERTRVACYIELKALGIGISRPADELWSVIAHELRQHGVIPESGSGAIGPDLLLKHIYKYLDRSTEARVMLLLDEADRFLQADGARRPEPFPIIDLLKQGMETTKRRFKVVFAGLHAVQRSALSGNNPLVHLGEQICIGPLRGERDARDARRLVTEPFGAIGYHFESPDLVTRILSQANYYPSLIQLSCNILLDRLLSVRTRRQDGPPWTITSAEVDAAYRDGRLREAIAERFRWTLVLDNRYQIIALALALRDIENGSAGAYRDDDIQQMAMTCWKAGFDEARTASAFRHLLMEMVGLGVLRDAGQGLFALRSLNVVPLLGTRDQIEQQLLEAQQAEPEKSFNPTVFRAPMAASEPRTRAPLTAHQLDLVRGHKRCGLVILRGGGIADATRVRKYLEETMKGTVLVSALTSTTSFTLLQRNLASEISDRDKKNGLLLVIECATWTREWVTDTWNRLAALTARDGWVRVVFLLHPKNAWKHPDLLQLQASDLGANSKLDFQSMPLTPWAADAVKDHLNEDRAIPSSIKQANDIVELTSGWPGILAMMQGRGAGCDLGEEALTLVTRLETDVTVANHVLDLFCVPDTARATLMQIAVGKPEPREWWPLSLQEAPLLLTEEDAEREAKRLLDWLEEFDYARPGERGVMVLDPCLTAAVKALRQAAV